MAKITVLGAGPVGSRCAGELAKLGNRVRVYEEHKKIGEPVQCTGIVTKDFFDIVKDKGFVVNRLKQVEVNSCNESLILRSDDVVIDRTKLDQHLADIAQKEGVSYVLGKKAGSVPPGTVVGADGPRSIVSARIGNKIEHMIGLQAVVRGDFDPTTYKVFLGKEFPGFFGWVVPENEETARVGTASHGNPRASFNRLMKKVNGKAEKMQGGLIPIYSRHIRFAKGRLAVVGDAAGQVKATTGGGLVPGLKCADELAHLLGGNLASYEKSSVRSSLWKHRLLRSTLDRFNDKDYDKLIRMLNGKMGKVLEQNTREHPGKLLIKGLINEPRMLLFARVLIRAKSL